MHGAARNGGTAVPRERSERPHISYMRFAQGTEALEISCKDCVQSRAYGNECPLCADSLNAAALRRCSCNWNGYLMSVGIA